MRINGNFIPVQTRDNYNLLNYPDCIYLSEQCKCGVLNVERCIGKGCTFCKNSSQNICSKNIWKNHLNTIPQDKQSKIARTYYGGTMPWKEQQKESNNV